MPELLQERENGWVARTRGSSLLLVWTLDVPHSNSRKHQAKASLPICKHGRRELADGTVVLKLTEAKDIPAIVRRGMLSGPKEKDEQLVTYKRVVFCSNPSCEKVFTLEQY